MPVDISNIPELLDLVEEVEVTKEPRALLRDNKPVALLTPIVENKEKWEKIKATFGSWSDIDADKAIADIHRWREEGSRPATRPEHDVHS
jgi:antitoxin (DNA-binding transcriptional repressor) of toxin-antitoxin stability system